MKTRRSHTAADRPSSGGSNAEHRLAAAAAAGSPLLFPRDYLQRRSLSPLALSRSRAVTPVDDGRKRPESVTGCEIIRKPARLGNLTDTRHLAQALELVLSIMGRMAAEGTKLSDEDQRLLRHISRAEGRLSLRGSGLDQLSTLHPKPGGRQSWQEASGPEPEVFGASVSTAEDIRGGIVGLERTNSIDVHSSPTKKEIHTPLDASLSALNPRPASASSPQGARPSSARTDYLLAKLKGVSTTSMLYKKLLESKSSLENLTGFAVACAANITPEVLAELLWRQMNSFGAQAAVFCVDAVNGVLFEAEHDPPSPSSPAASLTDLPAPGLRRVVARVDDVTHRLVRAMNADAPFVSGEGKAYYPIRLEGDPHPLGVVELHNATAVKEDVKRTLEASIGIAALSLRNGRLLESLKWQRDRAEAMLRMANQLSRDNLDEPVLVKSIIDTARDLTEADRCSVFLVKGTLLQAYFDDGNSVRMPLNTGIAGHVATSGETVNITDAYKDPRFNSAIDKATGYHTKTILCMPVRYEGAIVAVAQLINKLPGRGASAYEREFGTRDEEAFRTFSAFIGVCLRNCRVNADLVQEKRKSEAVLEVVTTLADSDIRNVDDVVDKVMHGAKHLLSADRATLFLIDKEHAELYSKIADATGGQEIRFPNDRGIAGSVAQSGVAENIVDAYNDSRFNQAVDKQLGYRTQSILCEPILCRGELMAVAQLVNKIDPIDGSFICFPPSDSETFRTFALFAGISLSNAALLDFAVRSGQEAMCLSNFEADSTHPRRPLSPKTSITSQVLSELKATNLPQWAVDTMKSNTFDLFKLRESTTDPLVAAVVLATDLIMSTGLPVQFNCPRDILLGFIYCCKKRYRHVPYHNFFHAVDACHTVYTLLYEGGAKDFLEPLDCFALLITALAHDLDHMGVNNSFHLKTDSPLGMLSSATGANSVLEVHHCNVCIEILEDPTANVFGGLDRDERHHAYRVLIDTILATDMARHAELSTVFGTMAVEHSYDRGNPDHRKLACQMIMKAADISNVTKPFNISRLWALSVTEEFFQQGDKERERGVAVLPMFDRQKQNELAKGQLGFINFVAKKFFEVFVEVFTGCSWTVTNLENNVSCWTALAEARRTSLERLGLNEDGTPIVTVARPPSGSGKK